MALFNVCVNVGLWQRLDIEAPTLMEALDLVREWPFEVRVAAAYRDAIKPDDEDLVDLSIDQILCPDGHGGTDAETRQAVVAAGCWHRNYEDSLGLTEDEFAEAVDLSLRPEQGASAVPGSPPAPDGKEPCVEPRPPKNAA